MSWNRVIRGDQRETTSFDSSNDQLSVSMEAELGGNPDVQAVTSLMSVPLAHITIKPLDDKTSAIYLIGSTNECSVNVIIPMTVVELEAAIAAASYHYHVGDGDA